MKQFELTVTGVRKVTRGSNQGLIIEVAGYDKGIWRTPQQAIAELQNELRLPSHINDWTKPEFDLAITQLVGKQVKFTGEYLHEGDEYEVTEYSSAVTDKNHKYYGKVKIGGKLKAETENFYVVGFVLCPKTEAEKSNELLRHTVAQSMATAMLASLGLSAPAMIGTAQEQPVTANPLPIDISAEVVTEKA